MTTTIRRPARTSLFVLSFLLLLAGLADGSAARAQAGGGALAAIRQRGELLIATDATYPPFEFKENGRLQGFDVDLGDELGRELGVRVTWVPMEWAGVFAALATRKVDLVMSGVTITDERLKNYNFTRPYFLSGQVIVRRKGDTRIGGPDDLKDKIVAVQQETTGQYAVEKRRLPKNKIHRFDTLQDALLDVRNSKSDAAVADLPALQYNVKRSYAELELLPGAAPLASENVGIVARKGDMDLVHALNEALETVLADGRYARTYQKWIEEPATTTLMAELDQVKYAGTLRAGAAHPDGAAPSSSLAFRGDLLRDALPLLLRGALVTLELTALTLLIGVPAGLFVALLRLCGFAPVRALATIYVELVRGTPLLIQIYVIYFVLPDIGISLPSFVAGVAALSLNAAAYISEIFRAGIESIDSGQMEAARALGMDYKGAMRHVILPQTLRRVLPPLTNESVALLKDSSLVSVVALSELMRNGKEIVTNTGSPTTIYLAVAALYLVMTLPLTFLVRRLEAKWQPISSGREPKRRNIVPSTSQEQ